MTPKERDELRKLQDRVIDRLTRKGYPHTFPVYSCPFSGADITLADLKDTIYPRLAETFRQYLA